MNVTESVGKPDLDSLGRKSCSPPEVLRALTSGSRWLGFGPRHLAGTGTNTMARAIWLA
jgi:hypothetical protein